MSGPAWLWPTARTVRWTPLLAVITGSAVAGALTRSITATWPTNLAVATCGAAASTVPLGLDDPALSLLSASPTSARAQLLRRLALVLAGAGCTWSVLVVGATRLFDQAAPVPDALALAALALAGVGAMAWVRSWRPATAAVAGASLPVGWVAARWYAPDLPAGVTALWWERSTLVAAVAALTVVLGARR